MLSAISGNASDIVTGTLAYYEMISHMLNNGTFAYP
jgi:hypothetical protein